MYVWNEYGMTRVIRTYGEGSRINPGNGRYSTESIPPVLINQRRAWWRHQMETFSALLALCAGNSPVTSEFPHKGQWSGALMFSLIHAWINGWVNNREAGDLRCHRAHYDVAVMKFHGIKTHCTDHFTTEYFSASTRIVHRFEGIALSLNAVTEQRFS